MRRTPSTSQNRNAGAERVLDQAREPDRHDEEQADREHQRDDDRADPQPAGDRLLLLGDLRVGGDPQRLEADHQRLAERDDPADDRPAQSRCCFVHETSGNDATSISPGRPRPARARPSRAARRRLAHRDRPGRDAAHHHALEHGLAADGRVALRPSSAPSGIRLGARRRSRAHGAVGEAPAARSALRAWRRGAGSARRGHRCPPASACRCRTGGSSSRSRRAARAWSSAS